MRVLLALVGLVINFLLLPAAVAQTVAAPPAYMLTAANGSFLYTIVPDYTGALAVDVCSGPSGLGVRNPGPVSMWPNRPLSVVAGETYTVQLTAKSVAPGSVWSICYRTAVGGTVISTTGVNYP